MKRHYLLLLFLSILCAVSAHSQTDLEKSLIGRTEQSIYKAQKEMIAGHINKDFNNFQLALKFQQESVKAFKSGDISGAVCYSSKARSYTTLILKQSEKSFEAYNLNADEKQLEEKYKCSGINNAATLNEEPANEIILLDPVKLSTTYHLSID